MLFDTHAHLDDEQYRNDLDEVIARAFDQGVSKMVIAACDEKTSQQSLEIAKKDSRLYCTVGIHPQDASAFQDSMLVDFRRMVDDNRDKVVAIGEIGLDYFYESPAREIQRDVFIKQIAFAIDCGLPIIVHDREAHGDCLEIIESFAKAGKLPKNPGIFHCYSGSYEMAKILLGLGFYLSFAGVITFKNAHRAIDLLPRIPLDRLLIETDCPYLSPEPFRGHRNEPANVRFVAQKMAEICQKTVQEIEEITFENACRLFRIPS